MMSRLLSVARGAGRLFGRAPIPLSVLLAVVVLAVITPVLPLPDPTAQDLRNILQPPAWQDAGTWAHPFGTDYLGRDLLSRILWGTESTLVICVFATSLGLVLGIGLGVVAAYYAGRIDTVISTTFDIILAVPSILIAIVALSLFGGSDTIMVLVLGIPLVPFYGRVVRSQALITSRQRYVAAAKVSGLSDWRITLRHVLPNAAPPALALTPVYAGIVILHQAGLAFLGLSSSDVSWGFTVSENLNYVSIAWWGATLPGLFILLVVAACNLAGAGFTRSASNTKGLGLVAKVRVRG